MNRTVWVCSKCGRTVENKPQWTRGWLIDSHKDAARASDGEMIIRCPDHVTAYAIRNAEHGRDAIRS